MTDYKNFEKLNDFAMETFRKQGIYYQALNDIQFNLNTVCILCKLRNHVLDEKCEKKCWTNRNLDIINEAQQEVIELTTKELNGEDCLGLDCDWCLNPNCLKEKKGNENE